MLEDRHLMYFCRFVAFILMSGKSARRAFSFYMRTLIRRFLRISRHLRRVASPRAAWPIAPAARLGYQKKILFKTCCASLQLSRPFCRRVIT